MRVNRTAAAVACAAVATAALPALAVGSFGPPHKAAPAGCYNAQIDATSSGIVHGFVSCVPSSGAARALYAVTAASTSSAWTLHKVVSDAELVAAADDGTKSYALYDHNNATFVLSDSRAGHVVSRKLAGHVAEDGTIAARNGDYWAVYALNTQQGSGCLYLFQSKTIGTNQRNKDLKTCGEEPSISVRRGERATLAYRVGDLESGGRIELTNGHNDKWGRPHKVSGHVSYARLPVVRRSGRTTQVTWLKNEGNNQFDVVYMSKTGSHGWQSKHFKRLVGWSGDSFIQPRGALIAPSGKNGFFLAWTAIKGSGSQGQGVIHVEQKSGSSWSASDIDDGTSSDVTLSDLDSTPSGAYVVMTHDTDLYGSYTVTRSQ